MITNQNRAIEFKKLLRRLYLLSAGMRSSTWGSEVSYGYGGIIPGT